jgi:hypothetical protein
MASPFAFMHAKLTLWNSTFELFCYYSLIFKWRLYTMETMHVLLYV